MVSCGGAHPCSQNMAQLLRQRREGTIPASAWGRVSGGHTSARSASAGARGWGFHGFYGVTGEGDGCGVRPVGDSSSFGFRRSVGEHPCMIERLGRTATLQGHAQCVNRLCWNESGTALASCSDDTTVCLFDVASAKRKLQFDTGHTRNILGVRILPCTNDQMIVTGAMDNQVRLHKAPFSSEELTETFDCHEGRVNVVEVEPGNPYIFWSASEDGTVRQFDRRMAHGGCGWTSGSSTGHDDTPGAHIRRSRSATNCLVALTSEGGGLGELEGFFGRSSVSQSGRPQAGRANHVVCNPCDTNYLAVACGDLFARVFDRRTLSLGKASELRSSGRRRRNDPRSGSIPALSVCPTHEHLAAGGACSSDISGRGGDDDSEGSVERMMRSPLIGGHHSTCVAFSPDGRNLLVSYHRDHVYLFDASGAKRSSSAISDPAISSYFMPAPPPPLAHADTEGGGDEGGKGPPRRSARPQDESHRRLNDVTRSLLDAHRALSAWDGRGEPPVTRVRLVELYRKRYALLRARGWRGDRYMALLDAARARELAPMEAQPRWDYIKALAHAGKRSASRAEAADCLTDLPELRPQVKEFLQRRGHWSASLGRGRSSGRRNNGFGDGVGGSAAEEKGNEEEEEEEEEEQEDRDRAEGFSTPPRGSRRGGGGNNSNDERSHPSSRSRMGDDVCVTEELSRARDWYRIFSRTGDAGEDPRCLTRGKSSAGKDKDEPGKYKGRKVSNEGGGRDRGGNSTQWTGVSGRRSQDNTWESSCPRAMIQWYPGACNVQTVIKEACFLGERGGYVAAGSDDGRMFIWKSASGRLVRAIEADNHIVNCVAPHPSLPTVATSGLENVVKLWSPMGAESGDQNEGKLPNRLGSEDPRLMEISRNNQGDMEAGVGLGFALQPLMHQLVVQVTAAANASGSDDDERGPGECIQA